MTTRRPLKSDPFGVRFDSEEQRARFVEACQQSDLAPADALRMGAQAMVVAFQKFGKIPRDMEVRQAPIGAIDDMKDLLRRAVAIGEAAQATYGGKGDEATLIEIEANEAARRDGIRRRAHSRKPGA